MKTQIKITRRRSQGGFTLIETLIGIAVFVLIAVCVYGSYASVLSLLSTTRAEIAASALADQQFEIIRNLSYEDVGIQGGLPAGEIPYSQTLTSDGMNFLVLTTIRDIYNPFGGSEVTADYKLVQLDMSCINCAHTPSFSFTTWVAPLALQTPSNDGALIIQAFNADGDPVADANVQIINDSTVPTITINDTTNDQGVLEEVAVPPGVNTYQITVSKPGYSTDQTYPPGGAGNPNPSKPNATVVVQQETQISFTIDQTSTLNVSSITSSCAPVPGVSFSLTGSKLIGTNPNVIKYSNNFTTDSNGSSIISGLEWDTYNAALDDSTYDLAGTNPLVPLNLVPNTTQNLQFIVQPKNPDELLVAVSDSATGLPLPGASVSLTGGSYQNTLITGEGSVNQNSWLDGSGQSLIGDPAAYYSSDGNINTTDGASGLKLVNTSGQYASAGSLISSTFDMGTSTNFSQISWLPQNEPNQTGSNSVEFQVATNNDNATWNFLGPDGTANTYYTSADSNINSINNGNRYIRYKVFLSTANQSYTPTVSDVSITFTSTCAPPGQAIFSGLSGGSYTLDVSDSGYQSSNSSVSVSSNWQQQSVPLTSQ